MKPKKVKVVVRCLGFGAEHRFLSSDPTKHRVCDKCQRKMSNPTFRTKSNIRPIVLLYEKG
jgi:hypothetical protein